MQQQYKLTLIFSLCLLCIGLNGTAQESALKKKPKRLKQEKLIYINEVSDQPAYQLAFKADGKTFRIDTAFVDLDISITVGERLYDPAFLDRMKTLARIYGEEAKADGFNRIVTHCYEADYKFPVTIVYYIPGAIFELLSSAVE